MEELLKRWAELEPERCELESCFSLRLGDGWYRVDAWGMDTNRIQGAVQEAIEARGWLWLISNLRPSNEARAIVGPGDTMDDGYERIASNPVAALLTAYIAALEAMKA